MYHIFNTNAKYHHLSSQTGSAVATVAVADIHCLYSCSDLVQQGIYVSGSWLPGAEYSVYLDHNYIAIE